MQNVSAYYTVQSRFDQFFAEGERRKNLLFVVLVDNTSGHFTHCSHFSNIHVSTKTPNKMRVTTRINGNVRMSRLSILFLYFVGSCISC